MEGIFMTTKELTRLETILKTQEKRLTQNQAAEILGLSVRQIKRLCKSFRSDGAKGLVSKKRGSKGNNRLPLKTKQIALEKIIQHYKDFGPTFAHEKLTEVHGLALSIGSVRNIMIKNKIWQSKRLKRKIVHQLRPRRDRIGELIQVDGSPDDWFENRGPRCVLLVYIDDATSQILDAMFVHSETTWDYMKLTKRYISQHGRPIAFYSDKHSIFRVNKSDALSGNGLTQFGRALKELKIGLICANSPQAKGRVERANKTLQDRLKKELRLLNICTIEEANSYLPTFLQGYNKRFAKVPTSPLNAHLKLPQEMNLDRIFTIQETRHLSKNLTFQYNNKIYQIKTERPTYTLRKATVKVLEKEDGKVIVEYKGKELKYSIYEERPFQGIAISELLHISSLAIEIHSRAIDIFFKGKKSQV